MHERKSAGEQPATEEMPSQQGQLERAVGRRVRGYRRQLGRTASEVARAAGLSPGMLSKIENGATTPSLSTVAALARALNVSLSAVFDGVDERCPAAHVPAERILAHGRNGGDTRLLAHVAGRGVTLEPVVIALNDAGDPARAQPLPVAGAAFVHILAGELIYRHGEDAYRLRETDGLALDAEVPHGPETIVRAPVRLLLVQARART